MLLLRFRGCLRLLLEVWELARWLLLTMFRITKEKQMYLPALLIFAGAILATAVVLCFMRPVGAGDPFYV